MRVPIGTAIYNMLTTEESIQGRKSKLEVGFYSSPDPRVAEDSAQIFTFKKRKVKVMIQSRVNMNNTTIVRHHVRGGSGSRAGDDLSAKQISWTRGQSDNMPASPVIAG